FERYLFIKKLNQQTLLWLFFLSNSLHLCFLMRFLPHFFHVFRFVMLVLFPYLHLDRKRHHISYSFQCFHLSPLIGYPKDQKATTALLAYYTYDTSQSAIPI